MDRSERGKLALTGADAVEFLNGQVTNELLDLKPGEGRYAAFLTHKGKMLGDLRILAVGENGGDLDGERSGEAVSELLLDTERTALQALFDMIRRFKVGYEVELHKRTIECSLLSLIGPGADEVAAHALSLAPSAATRVRAGASAGTGARKMPLEREHAHLLATIAGTPVRLIRTDVGIDALLDSAALAVVRGALEAAGAVGVGEAAAEIVRIERGRPRYGIDLDESTIPQEAGLNERAVSFTKGCYVGQETVARLHYKGKPNRHLRGLRLSEPRPQHRGPSCASATGRLGTSEARSSPPPSARSDWPLLRREAEPGATVAVGESGATASIVELPFQ